MPLGLQSLLSWLYSKGELQEQVIKSGIWAGAINVGDRAIQLLKLVILARLLSPSDFGLLGIALLTLAVFDRFSRLGLDKAMIQKELENINPYLDEIWSLKIARGLIIAILGFLIAPIVAKIFGSSQVTNVIRTVAIIPLLRGVQNPAVIYFRKDLEFEKQFIFKLSGSVGGFIAAIAFALYSPTVWALVVGQLSVTVIRTAMSYKIVSYHPCFSLDYQKLQDIIGYGKWITAVSIIGFCLSQGDDALVAWLLGPASLGLYQMSYRLSNSPATEITEVISQVTMPAFAKIQNESNKLRSGYIRTLNVVSLVSFPTAVGIIVIAPPFVNGILGPQWNEMILIMQLLAGLGLLRSVGSTISPLFEAIGRPDINAKIWFLKLLFLAIIIYPAAISRGLVGVSISIIAVSVLSLILSSYLLCDQIDLSPKYYLRMLLYPLVSAGTMGAIIFTIMYNNYINSPIIELIVFIPAGVLLYIFFIYGTHRYTAYEGVNTFITVLD